MQNSSNFPTHLLFLFFKPFSIFLACVKPFTSPNHPCYHSDYIQLQKHLVRQQRHLLLAGHLVVHQQNVVVLGRVPLTSPHPSIQDVRSLHGRAECPLEGGGEVDAHLTGDGVEHTLLPSRRAIQLQVVVFQESLEFGGNFFCRTFQKHVYTCII